MPYAITGQISQAPIEGGISITGAQYRQALDALTQGKRIVVQGDQISFQSVGLAPEQSEPARYSVRQFRARFTQAEQIAIRSAALTDMQVGLVYDDFMAAQYIDLSDPAVELGIDLYISKGLLDASRKADLMEDGHAQN